GTIAAPAPSGGATPLDSALAPGEVAAHFDHDLAPAVIVAGHQRVGRLCVIVVGVLAAHRHRGLGPLGVSQSPPADAHLMHALITDIAVAGVPEPVPVVAKAVFV